MRRITLAALMAVSSLTACASASSTTAASNNGAPSVERSTYKVSWDLEYGYVFDLGDDRFFPDIAESELTKFDYFFSDAHMATVVGKRIYCDCEISATPDGSKRRVERATLYAR